MHEKYPAPLGCEFFSSVWPIICVNPISNKTVRGKELESYQKSQFAIDGEQSIIFLSSHSRSEVVRGAGRRWGPASRKRQTGLRTSSGRLREIWLYTNYLYWPP